MKNFKTLQNAVMLSVMAGSLLFTANNAFAAEDLQEFAMDDFVVTASRTKTAIVDTPVNMNVIDAQTIENRHYTDVAEALKDVPGAVVVDNGYGAVEKKIILNGDERVVVLVDGRRVNIDMGTMSRASFDLNQLPDVAQIERIEVVKGHGGALYGSDAVGGVVNIITKKADHKFGKRSFAMGSNQARDFKSVYAFKKGKTGVTLSGSKYKQGYYKYKDAASDSTQRWGANSKYENNKFSIKVDQDFTDTTSLTVGYDYSKFEGFSPYSATSPSLNPVDKKTNNFYAQYNWLVNDEDAGFVNVYHNQYEYFNQGNMEEKDTGFEAQQTLTVAANDTLVFGASYRKAKASNAASYSGEKDINNAAVFVNNTWEFMPSWSLNTGVRYDKHSEFGSETTMSAGLNKKFDENSHAYFNWGQVFKAPTMDDLYYYFPFMDIGGSYGNPDLKPEKGDTWTIGYGTTINDKTDINISYFQSDLDDAIDWDSSVVGHYIDQNGKQQDIYRSEVKNIKKQKKNGMEISVDHELNDNWDLTASYTYVRVRNNNNNSGFVRDANYVPNVYRLGVRYHDLKWNADLTMRAGSGADHASFVDSSYLTMDMAVTYKADANWSIFAKGYNLTNEAYADCGGVYKGSYNYPAQARRFMVGAEYSF